MFFDPDLKNPPKNFILDSASLTFGGGGKEKMNSGKIWTRTSPIWTHTSPNWTVNTIITIDTINGCNTIDTINGCL